MMPRLLALLLSVFLASCAVAPTGDPLEDLRQLTTLDAKAALADATAHQDVLAVQCYQTILTLLPTLTPAPYTPAVGVLSEFQHVRNIDRFASGLGGGDLRTQFLLGCAPLGADVRDVLIKLGVKLVPKPF